MAWPLGTQLCALIFNLYLLNTSKISLYTEWKAKTDF